MRVKSWRNRFFIILSLVAIASTAYAAYHHAGDTDSQDFQVVYPEKTGTKLDHCALCHSSGQYEKKPGMFISLGSCQWCHYAYGYDKSGDIEETLNDYGRDYRDHGRTPAAFEMIEQLDSDNDGFTNKVEIQDNRYPGDPNDDPTKVEAPYRVYTKEELEKMPQHKQFMLMNTHKSGDFYAEYSGVPLEEVLMDAGMLGSASGISVHAPDGWSQFHPLEPDADPLMYPVFWEYPAADYFYETEADDAITEYGWCDYSSPAGENQTPYQQITNEDGNRIILAIKRDGNYLESGELDADNRLNGEGPFRVVPPQKIPGPPDQSVKSDIQDVIWPFDEAADHNAGFATRSSTIIRVEPLPEGTTDINTLEAGWNYVDQGKIVVYGAIDPLPTARIKLADLRSSLKQIDKAYFKRPGMKFGMIAICHALDRSLKKGHVKPVTKHINRWLIKKVDGCVENGVPDRRDWITDCDTQKNIYWKLKEICILLGI